MTAQLTSAVGQSRVFCSKFPAKWPLAGNFGSETGSHMTADTTIQSSQTGETVLARKVAVSAGNLDGIARLLQRVRSRRETAMDSCARSPASLRDLIQSPRRRRPAKSAESQT